MTGNIPDTVVVLRDQAEEFPLCHQLHIYLVRDRVQNWGYVTKVRIKGQRSKHKQGNIESIK